MVLITLLVLAGGRTALAFGVGYTFAREPRGRAMEQQNEKPSPFIMIFRHFPGLGMTMDTAGACDRLFNYRVGISFTNTPIRTEILSRSMIYTLNSFIWNNTFGFAYVRNKFFRMWAGPHFSLCYEFINDHDTPRNQMLYAKFGPVAGVDFKASDLVVFSIELGVRGGYGTALDGIFAGTMVDTKLEPYAGISLLYRTWDLTSINKL